MTEAHKDAVKNDERGAFAARSRMRMRLKVERLAKSLTDTEQTKRDIVSDDGEEVTGVRIGWGAWALLRAAAIDLIEYKCESDETFATLARAASPQAPAVDGAEAYGYAPISANGNYFTRNKATADYVGGMMPVYAAPLAREAATVALTDEQILEIAREYQTVVPGNCLYILEFARALLAVSPAAESKTLPRESEGATPLVSEASPDQ